VYQPYVVRSPGLYRLPPAAHMAVPHTMSISDDLQQLRASLEELNEPLAAILSNAQAAQRFLAQEEPDLDEIREILADIVADAGSQLASLLVPLVVSMGAHRFPQRHQRVPASVGSSRTY